MTTSKKLNKTERRSFIAALVNRERRLASVRSLDKDSGLAFDPTPHDLNDELDGLAAFTLHSKGDTTTTELLCSVAANAGDATVHVDFENEASYDEPIQAIN